MRSDTKAVRRPARGNRWGLALVGVLLVAVGALALAAGRGLLGARPASMAPAEAAAAAGLSGAWLPYAVAAAAVLAGLLALRWMYVQGRSAAVGRLVVEPDCREGTTEIPSGAARGAFEDQVGEYTGVRRARAQMTASQHAPRIRLDLTVDDDADVGALWQRVRSEALADLREALELERLPAVIRLSMAAPPKNPRRRAV
ncbi:hypothetical protein GCM10027570_39310 [Streptomonospora sediminis]